MENEKNLETKYRNRLKAHGYLLRKSRGMTGLDNLGGYMIVDQYTNAVVTGARYELTLDDVATFAEED